MEKDDEDVKKDDEKDVEKDGEKAVDKGSGSQSLCVIVALTRRQIARRLEAHDHVVEFTQQIDIVHRFSQGAQPFLPHLGRPIKSEAASVQKWVLWLTFVPHAAPFGPLR